MNSGKLTDDFILSYAVFGTEDSTSDLQPTVDYSFVVFTQALNIIGEVGSLLSIKYSRITEVPFSENDDEFRQK